MVVVVIFGTVNSVPSGMRRLFIGLLVNGSRSYNLQNNCYFSDIKFLNFTLDDPVSFWINLNYSIVGDDDSLSMLIVIVIEKDWDLPLKYLNLWQTKRLSLLGSFLLLTNQMFHPTMNHYHCVLVTYRDRGIVKYFH